MLLKKDVTVGGYIGKFKVVDFKLKYSSYTDITRAACPNCGTLSQFSYSIPETKQCRICKTFVFEQVKHPRKVMSIVGKIQGEFTIISADERSKTMVCTNKTITTVDVKSNKKVCDCALCSANKSWTRKKYSNTWKTIRDSEGLFWKSYMDFESWIEANLSYNDSKPCLNRIDKTKPYEPYNVWWSSSPSAFPLSYWSELVPKQDNIRLVGDESKYLFFECDRGHKFKRLKGRVADRSKKEGYAIQCEHCKNEDAAKRAAIPKQVRLTIQEQIARDTPSITLVSDNASWDDAVGHFECSECNTGFSMPMKVFASKQVCPICKSEKRGKFCDSEVERKFGGKIIRTGVWTRCDVPTTWKCLKHGTHFKKTYDKVKASQSGGCPDCIEFSVPDPDVPTTLYYVRLKYDNTHFYKIGITQRTVYTRFDGEIAKKNLHIVKEWVYPTWREAYDAEQKILMAFQGELLCKGETPLRKSGNTEIFYHDVLELDHAHKNH